MAKSNLEQRYAELLAAMNKIHDEAASALAVMGGDENYSKDFFPVMRLRKIQHIASEAIKSKALVE